MISIEDNGTGTAGNVYVSFGDGSSFDSTGAVDLIIVAGGKGNDQISYDLASNLETGVSQSVVVEMGAKSGGCANTFTASIAGSIEAGALLDIAGYAVSKKTTTMTVNESGTISGFFETSLIPGFVTAGTYPNLPGKTGGQSGSLDFSESSTGNIDADGDLSTTAVGSSEKDNLSLSYYGTNDGVIELNEQGERGNDQVLADVEMTSGSTGLVGSAATPATVEGGAGRDRMEFLVRRGTDSTSSTGVSAQIIGDSGKNSDLRTQNVVSKTVETDILEN